MLKALQTAEIASPFMGISQDDMDIIKQKKLYKSLSNDTNLESIIPEWFIKNYKDLTLGKVYEVLENNQKKYSPTTHGRK